MFWCLLAFGLARADDVVFVTWDGVRHEEFVNETVFPWVHSQAKQGNLWLFGDSQPMTIHNWVAKSLPGYQSIFSGHNPGPHCLGNTHRLCGQIRTATLPDQIAHHWGPSSVQGFASWGGIARAFSTHPGSLPWNAPPDIEGSDTRPDSETWTLAWNEWRSGPERKFFYIGLNDSDREAHQVHWEGYISALRRYDRWLAELSEGVSARPRTWIVVTTDHGRGQGYFWRGHGWLLPSSREVFAIVIPPRDIKKEGPKPALTRHADLRPWFEKLLGLVND